MYAHTGGTYMIIGETIFDILYLLTVITIGIKMLKNSPYKSQYWLFGLLAVILGFGDAFIWFRVFMHYGMAVQPLIQLRLVLEKQLHQSR